MEALKEDKVNVEEQEILEKNPSGSERIEGNLQTF